MAAPVTARTIDAADVAERALWTLVQTAGAGALVIGWNALNIGPDVPLPWVPVVALVLSVVKGQLATRWGNGTASTLPGKFEPEPAQPAKATQPKAPPPPKIKQLPKVGP